MHSLGFFAPSSLSHFSLTMFVPPCVPHVHDSDGPARWASTPPRNPSPRFFLHEANSRPSSTNIKSPRSRRLFRAGHNISKCFQRDRSSSAVSNPFLSNLLYFPNPNPVRINRPRQPALNPSTPQTPPSFVPRIQSSPKTLLTNQPAAVSLSFVTSNPAAAACPGLLRRTIIRRRTDCILHGVANGAATVEQTRGADAGDGGVRAPVGG